MAIEPAPIGIAALSALGVMLLLAGTLRGRRRLAAEQRIATLVGGLAPVAATRPERAQAGRVWPARLVRWAAALQATESPWRGPLFVLALAAGLLGMATLSPAWFGVALIAGAAAYALGARARRLARFEAQTLDTVRLLASGLRAGYSVPQAIDMVARHSQEPTAAEFGMAARELGVGIELGDALANLAARTRNGDYQLVAIIVRVQHEVGGNLAQILDAVAETLRERIELRQQVAALTAQQRLSSMVLSVLPFALLVFLFVMDRSFVEPLFTETLGRVMLLVGVVLVLIGWSVMRSIGRVEV